MHSENKLSNHGKQVTSGAQSQLPNVNQAQQQGPAGNQGSKGSGSGSHGVKSNQISPGNPTLKSLNQSGGGISGMMKTKAKRERSVSMDTGDQRESLTPVLEPDAKVEGVMRSKRRCVLERKQPYSGDEWCSGAETEEEDEKPLSATHREHVMCPSQGHSVSSATGHVSDPGGPGLGSGHGPSIRTDLHPRPPQQVVYVFTTSLANSAAEAVMHGHADSILLYHQQNVPRTKLDQSTGVGKLTNLTEISSSHSPPIGTPKSQSGTPRPASVGGVVGGHLPGTSTPSSTGHPDSEPAQTHRGGGTSSSNSRTAVHSLGPGSSGPQSAGVSGTEGVERPGTIPHHGAGVSPSSSPSALSVLRQSELAQRGGPGNTDGLSKEQLEHRERSLQTLRDIERLLLRSGAGAGHEEPRGPNGNPNGTNVNNNNNSNDGGRGLEDGENGGGNAGVCHSNNASMPHVSVMKKYEEPLQSIISQTQNLGGPGLDDSLMGPHHSMQPHSHHLSSPSGLDMGPLLGPEGVTPEQLAWRKLQEEYYQEKRRQHEINPHQHPQHFRMIPEMGMPGGPPMLMRGPPPPYHSKPVDQQWGPGPMVGGGMGGNSRIMDMHQEGPRGPRFLGQMRGPSGGGVYTESPGGVLGIEGLGPQRPPRPGMGWLEEMPPNMGGGGPFHGCYPPGGPGGPPQHFQGDLDRPMTREEMFRRLHRLDMQQISRQQQQQQAGLGGPRMIDNSGGPGFPNPGMGGGPPSRGDPMDFPGSRTIMGSPIGGVGSDGGPTMRDIVDSPLGGNLNINMGMNMNPQQQQLLAQKLRGGPGIGGQLGEMLNPEDISRIRASQNGRGSSNKGMISGQDGPLQYPNQSSFPGSQGDGLYMQQPCSDMFGPDQPGPPHMSSTSRLSHIPINSGSRGTDLGARHPPDLPISVNPMGSPAIPPSHQLKSPSLSQEPSPLMPSPSAAGLKSPSQLPQSGQSHPPLPAASGAGTPSSTSIKSPQVIGPSLGLRSPSGSPGHLKSPTMPVASPGWTASPKTAMPSPGGPPSVKVTGNGGSSSTDTGMSLPPRSSNSTPISQPTNSINPSMPFTSSPDAPPSQNPLSLIMSQMSKYAMPSSTPLYHDAIKTIATSDDEMLPDRPLLPGINMSGNMGNHQSTQMLLSSQGSMGPHSGPQSPMGMVLQGGPQLSHDPTGPMLPSPNPMGIPGMTSAIMGGGPPDGIGPCNVSPMHPQNQMGGFPRMQGPLHSPIGGMGQQYPQRPDEVLPPQQMHLLSKGMPHQRPPHQPDTFTSMSMGDGPDLSEVIRPSHTGIPEFDLSRIIPADKPSSTLQYFPKSEAMSHPQQNPHQGQPPPQASSAQLLKQLSSSGPPHSNIPSSNPHIANLQNMMAEQQLPLHPSHSHCGMRPGMGMPQIGSRGMGSGGGMGPICHPGHMMGRTGMSPQQQLQQQHHHQQQQAMMANNLLQHPSHPPRGMLSPQQHPHNLMAQQNLMMMQAKQRGMALPGEHFGQQGALMSPQGPMMGPPHSQSGMMGPQSLRQRSMSLDSPLGYVPGSMANMPF
ncbi:B-cell CLL/lymphoma 9-like protein isoform X5 [Rhinichthys klamathensis goyatoka]|uniref:B-cell CLL/lymphoma 9-like protein isoform X5 n=1 Tax=Rhinichthys klamathensis goyatoka TaxID=3034132 RepID=UPI0024B52BE6|nr:B-cell CLL/lymphoma 9-like protein isoform X5 [Rhinichthys klamathensis goyatoka]